jgi:hypothetical protein
MPYRIDIYIGSDNGTKRICDSYLDRVKQWANNNFPDGYTLVRGEGCYRGSSEDSLLINVLSMDDLALRVELERLKKELSQEAILVVKSAVEFEVV